MFTIKNILVPTDFSDHANNAISYAKAMAKGIEASLHVIHVVEPIVYPADWGYSQVGFVDLEKELVTAAEKELARLSETLKSEGFDVKTEVLSGRASDRIVEYAGKHHIDMIAIATHGRSGLEHFLFGSTTERVLRKADCPVLAVRVPKHSKKS